MGWGGADSIVEDSTVLDNMEGDSIVGMGADSIVEDGTVLDNMEGDGIVGDNVSK